MKKQRSHQPPTRTKQSFSLIEVLVALVLITLCLGPLLKPHVALQKKRWEEIERVELHHLAQQAFFTLKEELYDHSLHSWEELSKGGTWNYPTPFTTPSGRTYPLTYTIQEAERHLKKGKRPHYFLFDLNLTLASHTFPYRLVVKKHFLSVTDET